MTIQEALDLIQLNFEDDFKEIKMSMMNPFDQIIPCTCWCQSYDDGGKNIFKIFVIFNSWIY